ncbi:MAG: hypothetical protein ACLQIB_24760 [Isosphaeraceae bacterium]
MSIARAGLPGLIARQHHNHAVMQEPGSTSPLQARFLQRHCL